MNVFRIYITASDYRLCDADNAEHAARKARIIFGSVVRIEQVVASGTLRAIAQQYGVVAAEGKGRKTRADAGHKNAYAIRGAA